MASWLEKLFREHGVFKIPRSARRLPACLIRPIRDEDTGACEQIYQLNDGGNFTGGFAEFQESLTPGHSLYLVCEEEGEIRAMGGMRIRYIGNEEIVDLFYGLVHPDHHRRGFGTAMMFARLSVLPRPRDEWRISMYSVAQDFHAKFGFHELDITRDEHQNRMVHLMVYLGGTDINRSRKALQAAGIPVECAGCGIPVFLHQAPGEATGGDPAPDGPQNPPESQAPAIVSLGLTVLITITGFVVAVGVLFLSFLLGYLLSP